MHDDKCSGVDDDSDARTMAILRMPDGKRRRNFREAAAVMAESSWLDWPLEGPRTALWAVRYIAQHYDSPIARHNRFMSEGRLSYNDVGCTQHQVGCQMLLGMLRPGRGLPAGELRAAQEVASAQS